MGIFNRETLILSNYNEWIIKQVDSADKTIAIDRNNNILSIMGESFYCYQENSVG